MKIICGDALTVLRSMPGESMHCCVTSPPYWALRDYGVDGQLGLERTPEEYISRMVERMGDFMNMDGRNKRTVWTVATQPTPEAHFATYPIALIEPCILAGCPAGGTVLDPFCGAGTTGMAALKHGRDFVGIELNPKYIDISRERLDARMPLLAGEGR